MTRKDRVQDAIKTITENWSFDDNWKTDTEFLSELYSDEEIKTKASRYVIEDQFEEPPSFTTEEIEEITLALRVIEDQFDELPFFTTEEMEEIMLALRKIEDQLEESSCFTIEEIEEITLAVRKAFPKQDKSPKRSCVVPPPCSVLQQEMTSTFTVNIAVLVHYKTELDYDAFAERYMVDQTPEQTDEDYAQLTRQTWKLLAKKKTLELTDIDEEEVHNEDIDPLDSYAEAQDEFIDIVKRVVKKVKTAK